MDGCSRTSSAVHSAALDRATCVTDMAPAAKESVRWAFLRHIGGGPPQSHACPYLDVRAADHPRHCYAYMFSFPGHQSVLCRIIISRQNPPPLQANFHLINDGLGAVAAIGEADRPLAEPKKAGRHTALGNMLRCSLTDQQMGPAHIAGYMIAGSQATMRFDWRLVGTTSESGQE